MEQEKEEERVKKKINDTQIMELLYTINKTPTSLTVGDTLYSPPNFEEKPKMV